MGEVMNDAMDVVIPYEETVYMVSYTGFGNTYDESYPVFEDVVFDDAVSATAAGRSS